MNLCWRATFFALIAIFVVYINFSLHWIDATIRFLVDIEYETSENVTLLPSYDFIVVGAGSAGCAIAGRLSENPKWNVLLIEAGQEEGTMMDVPLFVQFLQRSPKLNWGYKTEPSDSSCLAMSGKMCNWPRGRVMGGSSVLNYMIYTRGNRYDFDHWAEMGADGWSFKDVLPVFQKMENSFIPAEEGSLAGRNGPLSVTYVDYRSNLSKAFMDGSQELGLNLVNYNDKTQVGVSYLHSTTKNGYRHSSNRAYIDPVRHRKNLHVKTKSQVTRILIDEKTKTATGVELYHNGHIFTVHANKEVIVSGGAINSPQLLMLSGIGPEKHLKEKGIRPIVDLPVGENLMDHLSSGLLTFKVNVSTPLEEIKDGENWKKYFRDGSGLLGMLGGTESIAFVNIDDFTNHSAYPNVEFLEISGGLFDLPDVRINYGFDLNLFKQMFGELEEIKHYTLSISIFLLRPYSRGRIELKNNDPLNHPKIFSGYLTDRRDVDMSIKAIRKALEYKNTKAFKAMNAEVYWPSIEACDKFKRESDEHLECFVRHLSMTIFHYTGTCKMGSLNDKTAVVNPRLQVIGVKNLRVADGSIMPEIVSGHPNAAIIMIGEKAAEMIKEDWTK